MYKIYYHAAVKGDLKRIARPKLVRLKNALEDKLSHSPQLHGVPLRGTLKGYWKLRFQDYRIIFLIGRDAVKVMAIAHRKDIYRIMRRRFET